MASRPPTRSGHDGIRLELALSDHQLGQLADLVADRLSRSEPLTGDTTVDWIRGARAAAEYMGCPRSRVYDLVSQDVLRPSRDGSRLVFRRDELDAYLGEASR